MAMGTWLFSSKAKLVNDVALRHRIHAAVRLCDTHPKSFHFFGALIDR